MGDLLIEKSGGTAINPAGFVPIYDADRAAVARHRRVVKAGPHDVQEPAVNPSRGMTAGSVPHASRSSLIHAA